MSGQEERIPQHIWDFVEAELKDYPGNVKMIENFETERDGIIEEGGNKRRDLASDRQAQNKTSDQVCEKILRLERLAHSVDRAKFYVKAIDSVLEDADPLDKDIVELKYWTEVYTNQGVAQALHLSTSDFYRRRKALIRKFAKMMGLY
jgi:RinA family phage transcriptional activator